MHTPGESRGRFVNLLRNRQGNGDPDAHARPLPDGAWLWTDDTEMACSLCTVLRRYGQVDQDALAAHYDTDRGYASPVGFNPAAVSADTGRSCRRDRSRSCRQAADEAARRLHAPAVRLRAGGPPSTPLAAEGPGPGLPGRDRPGWSRTSPAVPHWSTVGSRSFPHLSPPRRNW
ncbi:ADP-ribosylglycohydrolase family protein [Amycolatopsis sp. NPDC004079]|uniref:ADP-ribosylglycohydrolase family protein n=1 Tax=Amycolatopsis sp. NPDC004079 TaxID=3154549 RepID=UPI0033AA9A7C